MTKSLRVTIAITVDESGEPETRIFEAEASTGGDVYELALGVLDSVDADTARWLREQRDARRI